MPSAVQGILRPCGVVRDSHWLESWFCGEDGMKILDSTGLSLRFALERT